MASRRDDCIDGVARRAGRTRKDVTDIIDDLDERAKDYEHDGLSPDEAYAKARDEKLQEEADRKARIRRAQILDMRKEVARHRFYAQSEQQIGRLKPKLAREAPYLAMEAKLVGVNLPFFGNRRSVDAQYVALRRMWVGGMARDLEQKGLLKIFASRQLEDKWTDELFELNKGRRGNPGVTRDAQALEIAKVVQKWQGQAMAALNREGAWIRSYSGYITRTSHSAEKIMRAGPEKWVADTLPKLDLRRTFGTDDQQRAADALRQLWPALKAGDHFDYGKPVEEPLFANVAKKVSAERELHFKSGADWRAYNAQYGVSDATRTVVDALARGARRTALMKEFGTRPAEAFETDLRYLKARMQAEESGRMSRLTVLAENPLAPPADLEALRAEVKDSQGKFTHFQSGEQALRNRFAQIDGSSQRPVNKLASDLAAKWMAVQRMAKLGRVALTHFASLPTKAMEARYWGIPFAERYASLFRGLTQGVEGSAKRQALDATLVAFENRLGHMMATYDVADAPAGFLASWESTFFKLTGVSSVIDNQRGDAEAMFAAHVGSKRGQAWADIGRSEQRVLQGFGIGEAEWKALHGVEWSKFGDRTYLTPADAMKLSDDQIAAYMAETDPLRARLARPSPDDIAQAREDLALRIATAYSDRAGFAIPMPSARIRAMLFGRNFEPGTPMNIALRLLYQFKIWPADMVVRAWGREVYGKIGDGRYDRVAGLVEALVGMIVFGVASEAIREAIQGKDPLDKLKNHPLAAIEEGAQRSGFGSLIGDYLLGQYDRHGMSAVASLAGPTFGQIDNLMDIMHAGGETKEGEFGAAANRRRAADLIKLGHDNLPFQNLWFTGLAVDTLVWHRLQEWVNPGYLARSERRQADQSGIKYWMGPARTDDWLTGRTPAFTPQSQAPLGWNLGGQF